MPATTLLNAATTAGAGAALTFTTEGAAVLAVTTSNNFQGELVFEGSADGVAYFPFEPMSPMGATPTFNGAASKRIFQFDVRGLANLRPNITRISSGSVTVVGNAR